MTAPGCEMSSVARWETRRGVARIDATSLYSDIVSTIEGGGTLHIMRRGSGGGMNRFKDVVEGVWRMTRWESGVLKLER